MTNINNWFPPDKPKDATPIRGVARENYQRKLRDLPCPHCGAIGQFIPLHVNMHVGLSCLCCGTQHPLRARGVMWLPRAIAAFYKRRP